MATNIVNCTYTVEKKVDAVTAWREGRAVELAQLIRAIEVQNYASLKGIPANYIGIGIGRFFVREWFATPGSDGVFRRGIFVPEDLPKYKGLDILLDLRRLPENSIKAWLLSFVPEDIVMGNGFARIVPSISTLKAHTTLRLERIGPDCILTESGTFEEMEPSAIGKLNPGTARCELHFGKKVSAVGPGVVRIDCLLNPEVHYTLLDGEVNVLTIDSTPLKAAARE